MEEKLYKNVKFGQKIKVGGCGPWARELDPFSLFFFRVSSEFLLIARVKFYSGSNLLSFALLCNLTFISVSQSSSTHRFPRFSHLNSNSPFSQQLTNRLNLCQHVPLGHPHPLFASAHSCSSSGSMLLFLLNQVHTPSGSHLSIFTQRIISNCHFIPSSISIASIDSNQVDGPAAEGDEGAFFRQEVL